MTTADRLTALLEPLLAARARSALLFDFDGTLSPTVADPAKARPTDGVVDLLAALAVRFRTVAVVSGRPVGFLAPHVPPGVVLSGQYGLERREHDGTVSRRAGVDDRAVTGAGDDLLARGLPADALELKGLSLTVHFRTRPDDEARIRAAVEAVADERGLAVHDAKRSVELRPRIEIDKGTVVRELAAGAGAVLYVGDDLGDLPAFEAVQTLRTAGVAGATVAVDGPELAPAVRTAVDLTVDGTPGVIDLLGHLASSP